MKKRKLTDNLSLKIMSVAIAIVVWLIVVNIDNPVGTNYYTITDVELINKEYVESSDTIGKMCMPEENQDSVAGGKSGYRSGNGSDHSHLLGIRSAAK